MTHSVSLCSFFFVFILALWFIIILHTAYVDQNTPRNCWHLTPKFILMSDMGCVMSMATTEYNELSSTYTIIIYDRKMNNLFASPSSIFILIGLINFLSNFVSYTIYHHHQYVCILYACIMYNTSLYLWWILVDATTAFASKTYKTTNENILFCLT